MAIDFSKTKLNVPAWVQEILDGLEGKTGYFECEVAEDLRRGQDAHQDMNPEDFKSYYAEWAAFLFSDIATRYRSTRLWRRNSGRSIGCLPGETEKPNLNKRQVSYTFS